MRLYHGTSERHLESIIANGIRPRCDQSSNWVAESSDEAVYLTKCYAMHFAANARKSNDEKLIIIEIDTDLLPDPSLLLADEDAVTFAWRNGKLPSFEDESWLVHQSMEKQAVYFANFLSDYADFGCDAEWSLGVLGNCTYHGTIPPEAITRVVSYEGNGNWWFAFFDPVIAPANFMFCGSEYEATQLVLAERLDEAKAIQHVFPMMMSLEAIEELCARHRTAVVEPGKVLAGWMT